MLRTYSLAFTRAMMMSEGLVLRTILEPAVYLFPIDYREKSDCSLQIWSSMYSPYNVLRAFLSCSLAFRDTINQELFLIHRLEKCYQEEE
jgi:hypothetical protein